MKRLISIMLVCVFFAGVHNLQAQTAEQPLGFKVLFGTQGYDGDLGNELAEYSDEDYLYGVGLSAYLNRYFDLSLTARWMTLDRENGADDIYFERRNTFFETHNLNFNLMGRWKPFDTRLNPYLGAGVGLNFLQDRSNARRDDFQFAVSIPVGIGINYKLTEQFMFNVQGAYNRTFVDGIDNYSLSEADAASEVGTRPNFDGKDHDDFFTASIGVVFNFGGGAFENDDDRLLRQSMDNLEAAEDASNEAADVLRQAQKLNDETLAALDELRDAIDQLPEESDNLRAEMVCIVNNVQFEFDKSRIIEPAHDELNSLAAIMQEYEGLGIDIAARADERGTNSYNESLSMRRAQAVKDYLVNRGVSSSRITTSALGENDPLMSGRSETAHAQNRSVQLTLSYNP